MNSLAPKLASTPSLWFDAVDADTVRARGPYLLSWGSKTGSATLESPDGGFTLNKVPAVPPSAWRNAAVSADGSTVALFTDYGGEAYISDDYGATFRTVPQLRNPSRPLVYMECAMSCDGRVIVVCSFDGPLWVSRDNGSTWSSFALAALQLYEWCSVSDDGKYCLATAQGEGVFASSDYGASWARTDVGVPESELGFVYVSPTGDNQYIAFFDGPLAISSDRGNSFVPHPDMVKGNWYDLAVQKSASSTPACQVIIENPGWVWVTRDSGGRWTPTLTDRPRKWGYAGLSADGSVACVVEETGLAYVSGDRGRSFSVLLDDVPRPWAGVAVFVDGCILLCGKGTPSRVTSDRGSTWTEVGTFQVAEEVTLSGFSSSWDARTLVFAERNGEVFVRADPKQPVLSKQARGATAVTMAATPLRLIQGAGSSAVASPSTIVAVLRVDPENTGDFLSGASELILNPFVAGGTVFGCDTHVSVARTPVRGGAWCVAAMTTAPDACRLYVNGKLIRTQEMGVRAATGIDPMWIGGRGFSGDVGEIMAFPSHRLPDDGSGDWDRLHYYLGRKWGVPAALPFVPGMGSDPHVKTYRGGTYDVVKAGHYTLLAVPPHFSISVKVSPSKGGLYIESAVVQNGPREAKVTMKSRSLKWAQRPGRFDAGYDLAEGGPCDVKWDIQPVSPQRLVKVLSGCNPKLGRFCVRIDFQLRYVTPWFADFCDWEACSGILASEGSRNMSKAVKAAAGLVVGEHRPFMRNPRQMLAEPKR
jgi:photosystem II stability/assembly factor-like uncharacterized protein